MPEDPRTDLALRERVLALRNVERKTIRQIAEAVGRSPTRVYQILKDEERRRQNQTKGES
jgi:predicted transcriptional regulator